jgi:hypothetical protein
VNAEQVINLIKTLEPTEIERLLVLIKEYETEVRCRQAATRYIPMDEDFLRPLKKCLRKMTNFFESSLN